MVLKTDPKLGLHGVNPLIVDDNSQALEVMAAIMMGFGVNKTVRAQSAAEAFELAARTVFDVILIDYEMPEEDGLSLVRRLRSDPGGPNFTAPIIMVSANTPESRVGHSRDAGANFMIAKPVSPGVLLERLKWIARSGRQFVNTDTYRGPDRRFHTVPLPEGLEERREADLALTAVPDKALSQDEIDGLFT
ncbi:MAG: response regulator [Caulobacteraceae bacterium]|nr:response regulator [Caulobacteraceae bacterium]